MKALVLVLSNLKHDARVNRQIRNLTSRFDVTVAAFDGDDAPDVKLVRFKQSPLTLVVKAKLAVFLLLRLYSKALYTFHSYEYLIHQLSRERWDLIVANDADTLPMAFDIKGDHLIKIIFDAHEYAPRHFENRLYWRIFFQPFYNWICYKYIPKTDCMLTVGKGLANEYKSNFGKEPVVVTNATQFFNILPSKTDEKKIRLIYHGIANPSRQLDLLFETMRFLDARFTLDLILMTSDYASASTKSYLEELKVKLRSDKRITILPAVKSHEVVPTINKYDIGVFLLPPINFNYANTLPNKLFDYIQARLAVAIGPSPEMAEIVNQYNIGIVSKTFNPIDLAAELSKLTHEKIIQFKNNSTYAAKEHCAEKNEEIMQGVINQLFQ